MVKTMDKAEIREDFSAKMLKMLETDRDVFIQVLMDYVDDIGMGIAMEEGKEKRVFVSREELRSVFDDLEEE